jgi:hypothetical protein
MKKAILFGIISVIIVVLILTMIPLALNADTAWKSETITYPIPDAGLTHSWSQPDGIDVRFVVAGWYIISNPSESYSNLFTQDGSWIVMTVKGIGTPDISITWIPGSFDDVMAVVEFRWGETVRTGELACKMVWINEDNHFQFSFINLYADNNWVRIYDMEGNMVYEVDMPLKDGNLKVDLPDGMYMVKTFHDQPEPIQEFMIGKPAAEPAPDAEM